MRIIEFLLFYLAYLLGLSLPLPLKYFIACRVADLFYIFLPSRRREVWENLRILTGKDKTQTLRMTKAVYYNFARFVAEFLSLPRLNRRNVRDWIKVENSVYLKEAFSRGKGVICLTAHIGNWEWGGACLALLGYPINAIILPQPNPWVARLFYRIRTSSGMRVINVGEGAKKSLRILRKGEAVAILGDRPFGEEGWEVRFFGRKVIFPRGPATLAYLTGAEILPGFLVREKGRFILYLEKPWRIKEGGEKEKVIKEATERISQIVEKYVRKYPEQWLIFEKIIK